MMKVLSIISNAMADAVEYVVEKNRIQAQQNRLRMVMRNEAELMDKSYIMLGKYYYNNLRDTDSNEQNKLYCETIDKSSARMKKAVQRYKDLMIEQAQACCCEDFSAIEEEEADGGDITVCCSYDDEDACEDKTQEVSEPEEEE